MSVNPRVLLHPVPVPLNSMLMHTVRDLVTYITPAHRASDFQTL